MTTPALTDAYNRKKNRNAKKYFAGGALLSAGIGAIGSIAGSAQANNGVGEINDEVKKAATVGGSMLKYGALGASVGSVVPGWGTAIGAVVGAGAGAVIGVTGKRNETRKIANRDKQREKRRDNMGLAQIANNPSMLTGNLQGSYFSNGGVLDVPPRKRDRSKQITNNYNKYNGVVMDGKSIDAPTINQSIKTMAEYMKNNNPSSNVYRSEFQHFSVAPNPLKVPLPVAAMGGPIKPQAQDNLRPMPKFDNRVKATRREPDTMKEITAAKVNSGNVDRRSIQSDSRAKERGNELWNGAKKVTAAAQFVPLPFVRYPAMALNSSMGAVDAYDAYSKGDNLNGNLNLVGALPLPGATKVKALLKAGGKRVARTAAEKAAMVQAVDLIGTSSDLTNNFGMEKANGGDIRAGYKGTQAPGAKPGGSLVAKSSDGVEVKGNSHSQGGVKIAGAEVEGKETIKDNFVYSAQLGFAQAHKPLMVAKGKIEQKPATRERINALKILEQKENNLAMQQEYFKKKMGIK